MKFFKPYSIQFLYRSLAFLIPALVMMTALAMQGITWGSSTTILASDGFHQYAIFNQVFRNVLHGEGSIFYTFTSGLGLNFYALISYYLGSFFSLFLVFFRLESMPEALYLFTLIKFGLIGLSSFYSLQEIYKQVDKCLLLVLSTGFALNSFTVSQLEINMWLDVFIWAPLILLGLHRILTGQGRKLYYVSLSLLFIQNYYFGFMMAIFIALWSLVQLSWDFKGRWKAFLDLIVVSVLATLTSLVMLLPTYLDLKTHGETLTEITKWQTENSWFLDIFAKNLVGSYDTTKFGAIPMIYVGLLPLFLALLFFIFKSIKWQVRLAYALLVAVMVASFYLQPLDLFWQGMHAPNMFLHRYAWLFSLLVIFMSAETLQGLKWLRRPPVLTMLGLLMLGFLATFVLRKHYDYLEDVHFVLTLEFLLAYALLFFVFVEKKLTGKFFSLILLFFTVFEMAINTYYQVEGLDGEWHFPSRDSYLSHTDSIKKLVKKTKNEQADFFRTERMLPQTGNDSMKYNYHGISQFSSIRNTASSSVLDKLGFRSDGTNLNLRYQNNTLIADSLFAVKYNLSEGPVNKSGFKLVKTLDAMSLYENENALPLALMSEGVYKDVKFSNKTLDNQTHFLNQLTGLQLNYFTAVQAISYANGSMLDNKMTVKSDPNIPQNTAATIVYRLKIPDKSQLYINLPALHFTNEGNKKVQVTVGEETLLYTTDNVFNFFNGGYFDKGGTIDIRLTFPDNTEVSFDNPNFYAIDVPTYQTAIQKIKAKSVAVKAQGRQVTAEYQADQAASLLFTLPYDKGWSATLNGEKIKISRAQKGFMKVDIPKGKGTVKLTFLPNGFRLGLACFSLGLLLFYLYDQLQLKGWTGLKAQASRLRSHWWPSVQKT